MSRNVTAILYAVAAAMFYALNVPLSKLLLARVSPVSMAAYLYLGAGIGVGIMYLFHRKKETENDRLTRKDLPYTLGMILLDIAAPILLMLGVKNMAAAGASLLGNFEIVATALIALVFFGERVSGLLWAAIALITFSGCILSFEGGDAKLSVGAVFVLLATVCWGLENNCTRKLSEKSTYRIVTVKGIFSGLGSLIVALISREPLPNPIYIPLAMLLGFVAYGLSIFTYIRAQRTLGAAKTSAYYAIAPFLGTALSFVLLRDETLGARYFAALGIMLAGSALAVWDTLKKEN